MFAQTLLFGVAILLITFTHAEYEVEKLCKLTKPGTMLPSSESCQTYYTCLDNGKTVKSVCSGNMVFDKNSGSCVPESESNCYFGLPNPCHKKNNEFAYCSKGCNWYNYCIKGEIAFNATCWMGQRFNAASGQCVYGDCENLKESDVLDICEIMPDGLFFGDFENCRAWHKCVTSNQESGLCPDEMVFDVVSGYCLTNEGQMCQRTNNIVQTAASGPPQTPCTDVSQVVGDTNVCSLYYACEEATQTPAVTYQWVQKSCKTQYFDVITKTCNGTLAARPYPGCDRCEFKSSYSVTYWTNTVDPNCEQYFTCSNGKKINTDIRSCKDGSFFSEENQVCNGNEQVLGEYKLNNGACQDYTCTDERVCSLVGGSDTTTQPANSTRSKESDAA